MRMPAAARDWRSARDIWNPPAAIFTRRWCGPRGPSLATSRLSLRVRLTSLMSSRQRRSCRDELLRVHLRRATFGTGGAGTGGIGAGPRSSEAGSNGPSVWPWPLSMPLRALALSPLRRRHCGRFRFFDLKPQHMPTARVRRAARHDDADQHQDGQGERPAGSARSNGGVRRLPRGREHQSAADNGDQSEQEDAGSAHERRRSRPRLKVVTVGRRGSMLRSRPLSARGLGARQPIAVTRARPSTDTHSALHSALGQPHAGLFQLRRNSEVTRCSSSLYEFQRGRRALAVGDEHAVHFRPVRRVRRRMFCSANRRQPCVPSSRSRATAGLRVIGQQEVGVLQFGRVLHVAGEQEVRRHQAIGLVVGHRDDALVDHADQQHRRRRPFLLVHRGEFERTLPAGL